MKKRSFKLVGISLAILMLIMAAAVFTGCGEEKTPEIRGAITELTYNSQGKLSSFLVEGKIENGTTLDKAYTFITDKTQILDKSTGKKLTVDALMVESLVEVLSTGTIRDSYPAQIDASIIWILEDGE